MADIIVIPFDEKDFLVYENDKIYQTCYRDLIIKLQNYQLKHRFDQEIMHGYNVIFDSPYATKEQNEKFRQGFINKGLPPSIKEGFNYDFEEKYSQYLSAFKELIDYIDVNWNTGEGISCWYDAERVGVGYLTFQVFIFGKTNNANVLNDFKAATFQLKFLPDPQEE